MFHWFMTLSLVAWLINFDFTSLMGLLLYWLPVAFNAVCYFSRTYYIYQDCLAKRDAGLNYTSDTIGTLIGRLFMTVVPFFNLMAFTFTWFPKMFSGVFTWIEAFFDFKLVRPLKKVPGESYRAAMEGNSTHTKVVITDRNPHGLGGA